MARQDASHLFGDEHVRSYRETGGELGHDWKEGTAVLLLTTTGRRSGEPRTTPLIYGTDERPRLWEEMLGHWPHYADYQERTDREIPVVVLERR